MTSSPVVVLAGAANAGKTLLLVNFAQFLGRSTIAGSIFAEDARRPRERWSVDRARRLFATPEPLGALATLEVEAQVRKRRETRSVRLVDTPGLTDDIAPDAAARTAMAASLACIVDAWGVLHVVDASALAGQDGRLRPIDEELMRLRAARPPYAVIASKMDLPEAPGGLHELRRQLPPGTPVIPVSALRREGYPTLFRWLWRHV